MAATGLASAERFWQNAVVGNQTTHSVAPYLPADMRAAATLFGQAVAEFTNTCTQGMLLQGVSRNRDLLKSLQINLLQAVAAKMSAADEFKDKMLTVHEAHAEKMADQVVHACRIGAVILIHQALETLLFDWLRVCARRARNSVLASIDKKTVEVGTLRKRSLSSVEDEVLERWLSDIEERPLLAKWAFLFRIAPPPPQVRKASPPFDEAWIRELDSVRHDAAHHGGKRLSQFDISNAGIRTTVTMHALVPQVVIACRLQSRMRTGKSNPNESELQDAMQKLAALERKNRRSPPIAAS